MNTIPSTVSPGPPDGDAVEGVAGEPATRAAAPEPVADGGARAAPDAGDEPGPDAVAGPEPAAASADRDGDQGPPPEADAQPAPATDAEPPAPRPKKQRAGKPAKQAARVKAPKPISAKNKALDFLIIGAQRSGTTSLWAHLGQHPELFLPSDKELPFFSHWDRFVRGLDWYLNRYFLGAPQDRKWGTASPQYMRGYPGSPVDLIAQRIFVTLPGVRLIAALRDPIDRARSQHAYAATRGQEERPFADAVADLLSPPALEQARETPGKTNTYLVLGEYGRILTAYLRYFSADQLALVYTEDLATDPQRVVSDLFGHLGVDPGFVPAGLDVHHHRVGAKQRLDESSQSELHDYLEQHVWPSLNVQARVATQRGFGFWFKQWVVVPGDSAPEVRATDDLPSDLHDALRQHFARDGSLLSEIGIDPPWMATWRAARKQPVTEAAALA